MISAFIKQQSLEVAESIIVSDTLNYLKAQFIFISSDWNGLEKTVYFTQGDKTHPIKLDENNIAYPIHLTAGEWEMSVVGREYANGELAERITTDTATINVKPFKAGKETPFPEATPTEIERVEGKIGNLPDLLTKDKTSLVSAINEVYKKGGSGGGGSSGGSASLDVEVKTDTEDEYVLEIITDTETITTPNLKGQDGKSGVYVGSGEMPEGYNVQIDPNGEGAVALPAEYISYSNEEVYAEATNVKEALDIMGNAVLSIIDDLVSNTDRITTLEKTLGDIENGYY